MRLGIDFGSVRIGISSSDSAGFLASPLGTVKRDIVCSSDIKKIVKYVQDLEVMEIIVGLPRSLSGKENVSAHKVREYLQILCSFVSNVPVRLFDERLTTVSAQKHLKNSGVSSRKHRKIVDQIAAVIILQDALDFERNTGKAAGKLFLLESENFLFGSEGVLDK